MTNEQIIWNVAISLVVGTFLMALGAVLRPLFKRVWERINRPSPLTPQTKGQLTTNLAMYEDELKRFEYLSTHPRDLFLTLLQLVLVVMLFTTLALVLLVLSRIASTGPPLSLFLILTMALLLFSSGFCIFGIIEAGRMSEKNTDAYRQRLQKRIDDIERQLNPPV